MSDAVQLAERYFALSNAGKLNDIKALFTASSTYSSKFTGVYLGVDQIIDTFSGVTKDGEHLNRPGREYVIVYEGKLQQVEVRSKHRSV